MTPLGEENWKLVPGPSWTLPHVLFSIADLNLYPFVVINYNNEYNHSAKFSEFFCQIIELEGGLGDPQAQSVLRVHRN